MGARLLGRAGELDGVRGVVRAGARGDAGWSPTASTTARISSDFSASVVVADSPVVPLTTIPSWP